MSSYLIQNLMIGIGPLQVYNHRTTHGELITLDEEQRLHIDAVNTVWSHANKDNTRSFTEEEIKELENSRHEQS
ncbi:ATV_HP_G0041140.mRNA.1.CDS.1 [Saccharomyces cerevisiae]|nr:ATV_HP_G0118690.mRNA.1.CDS.1 [Saccharomyces cerevisiae]CAI5107445.1 ATV_HP_G0041140.mRNA.1.CDS.1 [Saccharomyces cerevisiae]CAI6478512.1 AAC_HP1_G0015400.mRNA.1.CDS.1 [Saccharomyces cerevisiae]CAI6760832.1 ATV_HP_G0118690.mRNA.1.CDS.1 [Saccharomyces cerevisiae]CAI6977362.1 ATV_HP_G0041140.mRNA.1.CDS.1 [Saccharomyces cerevisiae]